MGTTVKATLAFFFLLVGTVTAYPAAAQNYPTKLLRIIVPYVAGGPADFAVRNMANELGLQLGQQVVVDNRPGANGIIGWEMVARAAPDGYTLGYITNGFALNINLYSKLPYDSSGDFLPIILFGSNANLLTVTPSLPVRSVKELVELARAKPGALSYGSVNSTSAHLSMELLKFMTNSNMVNVSYKGIQQAHTDAISGQIQVVCDVVYTSLPYVKAGRVRGLAVTSLRRSPIAPEMPTFDEAGVPGYEVTNWGGYALPARAPRDLVSRLNAEINKVLSSPSVSKAIVDRGSVPIGGTPEQFAAFLRTETEKWGKIIKAAGMKPQ